MRASIEDYLCQAVDETSTLEEADTGLLALARGLGGAGGGESEGLVDEVLDEPAVELAEGVTPPIPTLLLNP